MKMLVMILSVLILSFLTSYTVLAAPPETGRDEAAKYFRKDSKVRRTVSGSRDHYLALHLGSFVDDQAYQWGQSSRQDNIGNLSTGVTYRIGEWVNSMDLLFRADFSSYKLKQGTPVKMSLMPAIVFPDANSRFPLYFGAGAGLGIYFKQIESESSLSLDYQLIAGARFFDVFENTGFLIETGLKNHFHLLSDGQFNGVFVTLGTVFTF